MAGRENTTQDHVRKYVSPDVAAQMLDVNGRTIRRLIASGHLAGYRLGGRIIRVSIDDVEALLRAGRIPTTGVAS